jgi:hypothetical protein
MQPGKGCLWVTEGSECQISHHTGPKGDVLLDPQFLVGLLGADVATKVAAAS